MVLVKEGKVMAVKVTIAIKSLQRIRQKEGNR